MNLKKIYSIYLETDPGLKNRLGFSEDEDVANSVAEGIDDETVVVEQHVVCKSGIAIMYVVQEIEPLNSMHGKTINDVQDKISSSVMERLTSIEIKAMKNKGLLKC